MKCLYVGQLTESNTTYTGIIVGCPQDIWDNDFRIYHNTGSANPIPEGYELLMYNELDIVTSGSGSVYYAKSQVII